MTSRPDKLTILRSVPTEMHAAILVSHLNEGGIDAWSEGGISSGYRAEAPGNANVLVRQHDLPRAISVLEESDHTESPGPAPRTPPTTPRPIPKLRIRVVWILVAWVLLALLLLGVIGL